MNKNGIMITNRKKIIISVILVLICAVSAVFGFGHVAFAAPFNWEDTMNSYNIKWESKSNNSAESMPVGGGNIGLNVWVEGEDLLFYIGSPDSIDEDLVLDKLGRVRIKMSPNPFTDCAVYEHPFNERLHELNGIDRNPGSPALNGAVFTQELNIKESYIKITGQNSSNTASIEIWVDIITNTISVDIETQQQTSVDVIYENWRYDDNLIKIPYYEQQYQDDHSVPGNTDLFYSKKDNFIVSDDKKTFTFYHQNNNDDSAYVRLMEQQGFGDRLDEFYNPLHNLIFGGMIEASGMTYVDESLLTETEQFGTYCETPYKAFVLRSDSPQTKHSIRIYTEIQPHETVDGWRQALSAKKAVYGNGEGCREATKNWWNEYWQRSYISINYSDYNTDDRAWQVGRHLALTRYTKGCMAFAKNPQKFNATMFNFDPGYSGYGGFFVPQYGKQAYGSPDFRYWGGGSQTLQNQRTLVWGNLKSGDYELLEKQFDILNNALDNMKKVVSDRWGHGGAVFYEYLTPFGLPCGDIYGWSRSPYLHPGSIDSPVDTQFNNMLEFAYMMLEYNKYFGKDISKYIDYIYNVLLFFYDHYKMENMRLTGREYDSNGRIVIAPSTSMETFRNATNPGDVVHALHAIIDRMLSLPAYYTEQFDYSMMQEFKRRMPLPQQDITGGYRVIKIADKHDPKSNMELPQLAALWPYDYYNMSCEDFYIARNTWDVITDTVGAPSGHRGNIDWQQTPIIAARLGYTDVCEWMLLDRMDDVTVYNPNQLGGPDNDIYLPTTRFPSFNGIEIFNWPPNEESESVGMTAAQEMVLQSYGQHIFLLPAWPENWEVSAKLLAGYGTEVSLTRNKSGQMTALHIKQVSDARDSIILHYKGIDADSVIIKDKDNSIVPFTRNGNGSITISVQSGDELSISGIPLISAAPKNVNAFKTDDSVQLKWSSVNGANSYNVYRQSTKDNSVVLLENVQGLSFKDQAPVFSGDNNYLYSVSAVCNNVEGERSYFVQPKTYGMYTAGQYDFENYTSGTQIADNSGTNNLSIFKADGTAVPADPLFAAGSGGEDNAFDFNSDRYLQFPLVPGLQENGFKFSADIYFKTHKTGTGGYQRILDNYNTQSKSGIVLDIISSDGSDKGKLRFLSFKNDGSDFALISTAIEFDKWTHLELSYERLSGEILVTADSAAIIAYTESNLAVAGNTMPLRIGGDNAAGGVSMWNFNGYMDNIELLYYSGVSKEIAPQSLLIETDQSIEIGQSSEVSVKAQMPNNDIFDWYGDFSLITSNPDVADVYCRSDGKQYICGINPGQAFITVSYSWNGIVISGETVITVPVPDNIEQVFFVPQKFVNFIASENTRLSLTGIDESGVLTNLTYAAEYSSEDNFVSINSEGYVSVNESGTKNITAQIVSGGRTLSATLKLTAQKNVKVNLNFDDVSDGVINSGEGVNGICVGDVEILPDGGGAHLVDGYIEVPDSSNIDTSQSFVLKARFFVEQFGQWFRLFDKKNRDTAKYSGFMLDVSPDGHLRIMTNTLILTSYCLPLNEWVEIKVVYDALSKIIMIFADGNSIVRFTNTTLSNETDAVLRIGADHGLDAGGQGNSRLKGFVDDIFFGNITVTNDMFIVNSITITGDNKIEQKGGTLKLSAVVMPENAENKKVRWEITEPDGGYTLRASVSQDGLVTALANGVVRVTAYSLDGSDVYGYKDIEITKQGQTAVKHDNVIDNMLGNENWREGGVDSSWKLIDGVLKQEKTDDWSRLMQYETDAENIVLEADFKILPDAGIGYVGFKIQAKSLNVAGARSSDNGLYIGVQPDGRIFTHIINNGIPIEFNPATFIPGFDRNKIFRLSVAKSGPSLTVAIDGEIILSYYGTHSITEGGSFAVYSGICPVEVTNLSYTILQTVVEENDPDNNDNDGDNQNENGESGCRGCNGSISNTVFTVILFAGVIILLKRRNNLM